MVIGWQEPTASGLFHLFGADLLERSDDLNWDPSLLVFFNWPASIRVWREGRESVSWKPGDWRSKLSVLHHTRSTLFPGGSPLAPGWLSTDPATNFPPPRPHPCDHTSTHMHTHTHARPTHVLFPSMPKDDLISIGVLFFTVLG